MYSDYLEIDLEPPPIDCYLLNDQSPPYDPFAMAELNDIGSQSNFDYVLNSYYVPVNQYNAGFGLLDDCKNLSFSELFDQELFSSHENKDCQITIKIENEEPCYSANESQFITDSNILGITEESFPSSTRSYSQTRDINRTFIKPNENRDFTNFLYSPFYDPDIFSFEQISFESAFENLQPDVNNTINQNTEPIVEPNYYPGHDSQSAIVNLNLVKTEDGILPLPESSISNQGINETSENDNQHLIQNPISGTGTVNVGIDTVNFAPENVNNIIEQNIAPLKMESNHPQGNSQIKVKSHNLVKVKNDPSSLSFNIFPKKLKRNGTFLNTTKHVKQPVYKPFDEPENIGNNQKSTKVGRQTVKRKPKDVINTIQQKIVETRVKPCYSDNNFQNTTNNHNLVKIEDIVNKSTTSKRQSNKIISTKKATEKCDVKHSSYNILPKDHDNDQMPRRVKPCIFKRKTVYTNNVKQNIYEIKVESCSSDDSETVTNRQNSVRNQATLKNSTPPKRQRNNKTSTKKTEKTYAAKHLSCNSLRRPKVHGNNHILSVNAEPVIKPEPLYINYNEQNIVKKNVKSFSTGNLLNTFNSHNSVKIEKTSIPKRQRKNKTCTITSENNYAQHFSGNFFGEPKVLGNNQISVKVEPGIKVEPLYMNYNIEQNIDEVEVESFSPGDLLQNTTNSHNPVKIEESFVSNICDNTTFTKTTEKNAVQQLVYNNEPKNIASHQLVAVKVEPYIKEEPVYIDENFEQNVGEIIQEYETKHVGSNDICRIVENNINMKIPKITIIKKENINETFIKKGKGGSHAIKTEINSETEKKKISWEEFRAKRGKIGLTNTSEIEETFSGTYDNNDIKKEFDRNTAEYLTGQKRKMEVKENRSVANVKDIGSEEYEELQKKRMKIEYIKKLLPSSFASEIAKTSSLMKGSSQENIDNEITSSVSNMFNDKNQGKYAHEDNLKRDDKFQKKGYPTRIHSSHRNSSRTDYCNKFNRSSNSDDHYNRNRIDSPHQVGPYGQNIRNNAPRSKEQKRVVYVGQIPIKYGKRYLFHRFKDFGVIQCLTLHKKPDFRVYYAFVTYSDRSEAERAINHGNDDPSQVQLDIRFGERKQTQTPYYDLDDEWLTDWYSYTSKFPVVRPPPVAGNIGHSYEDELKEFYNLAQMKKLNEIKSSSSQVS